MARPNPQVPIKLMKVLYPQGPGNLLSSALNRNSSHLIQLLTVLYASWCIKAMGSSISNAQMKAAETFTLRSASWTTRVEVSQETGSECSLRQCKDVKLWAGLVICGRPGQSSRKGAPESGRPGCAHWLCWVTI